MATTMNLIAKQTVGSGGAASVTFSNIPQTFTDLKIVASIRSNYSNLYDQLWWSINGTTTTFTGKLLQGSGASAASYNIALREAGILDGASATATTFGNFEAYIPNYTSSNTKSISIDNVTETNATTIYSQLIAFNWSGTSAITSIGFSSGNSSSFAEYSTFYLYGISNSSTQNTTTPLASGGDVITTDGTYWYHTFLYSGTFTPLKNLTCDYLVVAGGGGGNGGTNGSQVGGGGGAGGLRSTVTATGGGGSLETPLALSANTAYTATVGAGGNGGTGSGGAGLQGSNSIFSTITSVGGGRAPSGSGGSGGGGNYGSFTGGTRTINQGFAGGDADPAVPYRGGGGGGAGAAGSTGLVSGNGGNGVATSISGSSVTYAGGGGASATLTGATRGTGGTGGGGNGATNNNVGSNGSANFGGGGGGGAEVGSAAGGNGGSGIIVLRYPIL